MSVTVTVVVGEVVTLTEGVVGVAEGVVMLADSVAEEVSTRHEQTSVDVG